MDGTNWFKGNRLDLFLAQTSPNCPEMSRDQFPDLKYCKLFCQPWWVHLEILMIVAVPRVVNSLGYLQPAKEEDELEDEEDGDADVGNVGDLLLGEKSHRKVGIHSKLYDLKKKTNKMQILNSCDCQNKFEAPVCIEVAIGHGDMNLSSQDPVGTLTMC